jgi:hypothetical protein
MTSGEGIAWKMASMLKLAVLGHSDHHFGRFYHAVRCFRFGQGCLGPDQHFGKLPLRFVGPVCQWMPEWRVFFLRIWLVAGGVHENRT